MEAPNLKKLIEYITSDNVMVLRTLVEDMLKQRRKVVTTFVDYSAAFDSVSHKFLDVVLADAGDSTKSCVIFREIYLRDDESHRYRRKVRATVTVPISPWSCTG